MTSGAVIPRRAAPDPGGVRSALPSIRRFAFGKTGGSGAARRCRALIASTLCLVATPVVANEPLNQQLFNAMNACIAGIDELNALLPTLPQAGWVRVPPRGPVSDQFAALETEGLDISNGEVRDYPADSFEDVQLFQTRIMLLLDDGTEVIAFLPSTPFENNLTCSFSTSLAVDTVELNANLNLGLENVAFNGSNELTFISAPHYLRINRMSDGQSKPISGARTYIILSNDI